MNDNDELLTDEEYLAALRDWERQQEQDAKDAANGNLIAHMWYQE